MLPDFPIARERAAMAVRMAFWNVASSAAVETPIMSRPLMASIGPSSRFRSVMTISPYPSVEKFTAE